MDIKIGGIQMALSNWAILAMNEKGESCKGEFASPLGVRVSVYKNWISVLDEAAWQQGSHQIRPNVMHIYEAIFNTNAIYIATWSGWEHENTLKGMAGIGCYGYEEEEYVGVTSRHTSFLHEFLNSLDDYDLNPPNIFKKMNFNIVRSPPPSVCDKSA